MRLLILLVLRECLFGAHSSVTCLFPNCPFPVLWTQLLPSSTCPASKTPASVGQQGLMPLVTICGRQKQADLWVQGQVGPQLVPGQPWRSRVLKLKNQQICQSLCSFPQRVPPLPEIFSSRGVHSGAPSHRACNPISLPQVLCCSLLPADAGHGGRLWGEGLSSEGTSGHPNEGAHRSLLLLLPLLPTPHAHQVRQRRGIPQG